MIVDVRQHPFAVFLDEVLPVADKLYIIVVQPFDIFFPQFINAPGLFFIGGKKSGGGTVRALPGVRRIAQHHHNRRLRLNAVFLVRFRGKPCFHKQFRRLLWRRLKAVGQVHPQASGVLENRARFPELHVQFKMRHPVGRHKDFKAGNSGD